MIIARRSCSAAAATSSGTWMDSFPLLKNNHFSSSDRVEHQGIRLARQHRHQAFSHLPKGYITTRAFSAVMQHQHANQHHRQGRRSSSSSPSTWPYYLLASLPALVWCRDSFFDVVRVEGRSMEPTLLPGDWVLVRKADAGILLLSFLPNLFLSLGGDESDPFSYGLETDLPNDFPSSSNHSSTNSSNTKRSNDTEPGKAAINELIQRSFLSSTEVALLRSKIQHYLRMEQTMGGLGGFGTTGAVVPSPWLYGRPPLSLPGQVVVLKSPQQFHELHIKRVIAMGGQWLQSSSSPSPPPSSVARPKTTAVSTRLQLVPPYTVYVEGDNQFTEDDAPATTSAPSISVDSRTYGPVSNNCLVGVAECIVWPPRRWQRLRIARTPVLWGGRPRAFWRAT